MAFRLQIMAANRRNSICLNFLCCCFLLGLSHSETDTLVQGQQLRDGNQLVSAFGIFRLGFFHTGISTNRYLEIRYNDQDEKPVWVANRNTPILDNSGTLMIDRDGKLRISHNQGRPIELNSIQSASNLSATLLDSGNFVLNEVKADGSAKRVLWQSIDYPTDTLIPGMKLGINLKNGHRWSLTSWITKDSPSVGSFTIGMDPNGTNQLIMWWRGNIYWTSGLWENGKFGSASSQFYKGSYNFTFFSDENEKYFTYSVSKDITLFPKLTVDPSGALTGFKKDPQGPIFTVISCRTGAASFHSGCVKPKLPECRRATNRFTMERGLITGKRFELSETENLTSTDCEAKCLNNCWCVAYASTNDNGTGCELWNRGTNFTASNLNNARYIHVLESKVNKNWIWIIILAGSLLLIPILCVFYVMWEDRKAILLRLHSSCRFIWKTIKFKGESKMRQMQFNEVEDSSASITIRDREHNNQENVSHNLQHLSFKSIAAATNYFSEKHKLGEGGFGPVYKAKLHDGKEVAIKRLSVSSGQGLTEFKNEIKLTAKLQHTNLVRLLGWCIHGQEKILIYEYMSNGSLDSFLFDPNKRSLLNWTKRSSIIEGIAQGLLYLHKYSRLRVIHRDLKPSNILLDPMMNPKISDFGMARIFGLDESNTNTKRIVGTYGYMSPEYAIKGIVSTKTDVFSFGVLSLEIVCGKKNFSCYHSERPLNLIGYAFELWKEGRALELVDPVLTDLSPPNEVLRCINVGLLCVQDHPADRPTMSKVVSMLVNETIQLPQPKQPAFFIETSEDELKLMENKTQMLCSNDKTITEVEAR